jgi:hypothetical protein
VNLRTRLRKLEAAAAPGVVYALRVGGELIHPSTGEALTAEEQERAVVVKCLQRELYEAL